MKVGSLFTGYGGLDIAVGGNLAWYSEIDKPACKVLQTHYPNVPNLGDITKIDWAQVEPVDVITGGYPCQPFSHAGLRKGKNDERHLWPYVRDAIDALRPRYAILENVSGHLTLGFGDVLADLATIGFNAEWGIIRASDVGAPHGRKRLFIVAYADSQGSQRTDTWLDVGKERNNARRHVAPSVDRTITNTEHNGFIASEGRRSLRASSAQGRRVESAGNQRQLEGSGSSQSVTDTDSYGHTKTCRTTKTQTDRTSTTNCRCVGIPTTVEWGKYAPAIERWEHVLRRPAPVPTIQRDERQRLNPAFVEWMMGLDEGHVTGHGLSSAQELKMLGNGVVPQQARAAINQLLERINP